MINKMMAKVFGTQHDREMKKLRPLVDRINSLEPEFQKLSMDELKGKTPFFRERLDRGEPLDDLLPEAFATCREASKRILGMRHYDVQLIGGMILNRGAIAEMKTGEGKTLVATLPMYLNALSGKGAHLVTVNDYLASRDQEWMGQVYKFLGLTTGTIVHDMTDEERKQAYGADITYGTNNEFGFDYLRDNMKYDLDQYVQREHNFAIVDECDSILIDEARTPLIISGPSEESTNVYYQVNKIIPHMKPHVHFTMEEKTKTASLTEEGSVKCEELLNIGSLYDIQNIQVLHHIYQGLKAYHLYRIDVDYMVRDDEIVIVDEFTGRLMPGRRWSEGLHQAIEAKEGVTVKSENQTLATITFQNFFRMYNKLAGMTGTAETEAVEFSKIYSLDVAVIPTNKPIARADEDDVVYKTEQAKYNAMVEDIREAHAKDQPVLVGTVSIERSEKLSQFLKKEGVPHNVLNAKHHEREAEIVAQAGRKGSVTIATNMAGRGTDIKLGGNSEFMAMSELGDQVDQESEEFKKSLEKYDGLCSKEKDEVLEAGGLFIVGTERHESRRIDNQLRGRAGRQGDPGKTRFYLSLEDDLMRIFNGERIQKIMNTLNVPEDEPITAGMVSRAIEGAQKKVEGHQFDIRKHLLDFDDVMNKQRTAIYKMRRLILEGEGTDRLILDMLGDVTSHILDTFVNEAVKPQDWDLEGMNVALNQQFGVNIDIEKASGSASSITEMVSQAVKEAFDRQKDSLSTHFDQVEKMVLLQTIDDAWKEHLAHNDQLKEGINLRAYAQKDPLIEYKKEAFVAFEQMNLRIQSEVIEKLMKIQIVASEAESILNGYHNEIDVSNLDYAGAGDAELEGGIPEGLLNQMGGAAPSGGARRLSYSDEDDGEPTMNRAERRRMKKNKKSRR